MTQGTAETVTQRAAKMVTKGKNKLPRPSYMLDVKPEKEDPEARRSPTKQKPTQSVASSASDLSCSIMLPYTGGEICLDDLAEQAFLAVKRHRDGLQGRPPDFMSCETWEDLCAKHPKEVTRFREEVRYVYEGLLALRRYDIVETGSYLPRKVIKLTKGPTISVVETSATVRRIPSTGTRRKR